MICLEDEQDQGVKNLAVALVAVENYVRPRWVQSLEFFIATVWYQFVGVSPDFSFGIAQIKLSTVNKLIAANLKPSLPKKDNEIVQLLRDDCENIRIASEYLRFITIEHKFTGKTESACKAYNIFIGISSSYDDEYNQSITELVNLIGTYNGQSAVGSNAKNLGASFYNEITVAICNLISESASMEEVRQRANTLPRDDVSGLY